MKVRIITKLNKKGQIVIPKEIREDLKINEETLLTLISRGRGLYLYPIEEVITKTEQESSYLELLKKTQGAWAKEDWPNLRKKRKHTELKASKKRKQSW